MKKMKTIITLEINAMCLNCKQSEIGEDDDYLTCKRINELVTDDCFCDKWEANIPVIRDGVGLEKAREIKNGLSEIKAGE